MDAQDQSQAPAAPAPTPEAAPPQVAPQAPEAAPPSPDLAALQAKIAAFEAQLQEKESAWSQERELLRSGVLDPEAQEVAKLFYGKLAPGADGKKPSLSGWLAQRDQLPKAVAAYLPAPPVQQAPAPQAGAPQAPAPVRLPDSDRGAGAAPQASSSLSPSAIKDLTPEEYAKSRPAILASLGKR
ncbi:MAG: hypothetical protein E6Q97_19340 [Desulfurellales bacterium]|nr:MAG: hypothetical protein E6Q97_19340 [Desulfurellales bacterium]